MELLIPGSGLFLLAIGHSYIPSDLHADHLIFKWDTHAHINFIFLKDS